MRNLSMVLKFSIKILYIVLLFLCFGYFKLKELKVETNRYAKGFRKRTNSNGSPICDDYVTSLKNVSGKRFRSSRMETYNSMLPSESQYFSLQMMCAISQANTIPTPDLAYYPCEINRLHFSEQMT